MTMQEELLSRVKRRSRHWRSRRGSCRDRRRRQRHPLAISRCTRRQRWEVGTKHRNQRLSYQAPRVQFMVDGSVLICSPSLRWKTPCSHESRHRTELRPIFSRMEAVNRNNIRCSIITIILTTMIAAVTCHLFQRLPTHLPPETASAPTITIALGTGLPPGQPQHQLAIRHHRVPTLAVSLQRPPPWLTTSATTPSASMF